MYRASLVVTVILWYLGPLSATGQPVIQKSQLRTIVPNGIFESWYPQGISSTPIEEIPFEEFEFSELYMLNSLHTKKIKEYKKEKNFQKLEDNQKSSRWIMVVSLKGQPLALLTVAYHERQWQIVSKQRPSEIIRFKLLMDQYSSREIQFFDTMLGGSARYYVNFQKLGKKNLTNLSNLETTGLGKTRKHPKTSDVESSLDSIMQLIKEFKGGKK